MLKISTLLLRAAKKIDDETENFICHALQTEGVQGLRAIEFLKDLGMPTCGGGFYGFNWGGEQGTFRERSEARRDWCIFAAQLAKEQRL